MKRVTFKRSTGGNAVKFVNTYGIHPSILIRGVKVIYEDGLHKIEKDYDGKIKVDGKVVRSEQLGSCGVCVSSWLNCGLKEVVKYPNDGL